MSLPRFVVLQSSKNKKYLRIVNEDGNLHGFLQYSGEALVSPYTKFELEAAKTGSGLYHLRCSYNNKYWVREKEDSRYIIAGADEPDEDQSKWSCTLFQPLRSSDSYRFRHVQLNCYVCLWTSQSQYMNCLYAYNSTTQSDQSDLAIMVDWQSLCILPKYPTFKQGAYLKCFNYKNMKYLQFGASEPNDLAGHETFLLNDGNYHIKSTYWGYWRRDPDWIKADYSNPSTNDLNTIFSPVKVSDNVVALRNMGNNRFCKRLTADGKTSFLNASGSSIDQYAKMEVGDYATSREIYNVRYNIEDARIYNHRVVTKVTKDSINNTPETNYDTISLGYEKSTSTTWEQVLSLTIGVTLKFNAGIPLFAKEGIEVKTEFTGTYSWGETKTDTEKVQSSATVEVPPMSKRTVSVVASRGYCDIPFSYTQRDTLPNGQVVISEKHDGRYTGVNDYNFQTQFGVIRSLLEE